MGSTVHGLEQTHSPARQCCLCHVTWSDTKNFTFRLQVRSELNSAHVGQMHCVCWLLPYLVFHAYDGPVVDIRSLVFVRSDMVCDALNSWEWYCCQRSQPQSYPETKTDEASLEMEAVDQCHSQRLPLGSVLLPVRISLFFFCFIFCIKL